MQPNPKDVAWLLQDLCTQLGYSLAVQQPERFVALVHKGPESFADAVLLAEGLDPAREKRLHREVLQFVAARFERWAVVGGQDGAV
jgi:hypothetical protein